MKRHFPFALALTLALTCAAFAFQTKDQADSEKSFKEETQVSANKLNDPEGEGNTGPLAHGWGPFREARAIALPKAVYLVSEKGLLLASELEKHPEVRVVHTFQELQQSASERTAVWIDAGALGLLGGKENAWIARASRKKYTFALVGYNDAFYSFRETLDCFGIHGPGPVDWTKFKLTPGFSVLQLETKPTENGGSETSGVLRGYQQEPTVAAILDVTNRLLAGTPLPK